MNNLSSFLLKQKLNSISNSPHFYLKNSEKKLKKDRFVNMVFENDRIHFQKIVL